ncbi:MAG: hypothetical protein GX410_00065 [Elusimicrobia bacterium]|nr:hypothetical protein [Elusimicrobiota bacterium]
MGAPSVSSAEDEGFSGFQQNSFNLLDHTQYPEVFSSEISSSTAAEEEAPVTGDHELSETMEALEPISYTGQEWQEIQRLDETGQLIEDQMSMDTGNIPVLSSTQTPASLPPSVEMPEYGTSLSVTGRKIIGFKYTSKKYLNTQVDSSRPQAFNNFEMEQQMQIRMSGKIGPKITANVDYDDTKPDKQDISLVYTGDPQEVVQNASFGDIDLSLTSTEFVSYNKQLFGIRVDMRYKGLNATVIGSRTKGTTKEKQFVGNTQFQTLDLRDVDYMRRQYYDLTFGSGTLRLPIKQGSELVYLDNQNFATSNNVNIFDMTVDDLGTSTATYTGRFKLLTPGTDYTIDYTNGILTFKTALSSQYVVAVNFTNANGTELRYNSPQNPLGTDGTGYPKIIKTKNDVAISTTTSSSELGYKREIKTYYNIGQTQIVRDNAKGNFTLKVQDLNRNDVGSSLNPKQTYSDTISVDFEQGRFHLLKPFGDPSKSSQADPPEDPNIYATIPSSKYILRVEYQYRLKTFTLEPNIVVQSDNIVVDGVKFTRNVDYYIDYDSGFVTFYHPDRIGQSSVINITYDVSPYGGVGGTSSLVGSRVSYDLNRHMTVGGTVMYESETKSASAPNITDVAKSVMVTEEDVAFKNIDFAGTRSTWSFEAAQSRTNPNLNGFALVDNMEGIKQEDTASLNALDWVMASNPLEGPANASAVSWYSENVKSRDINPNAAYTADADQQVLTINYDLSVSSEVSIVYPFSDAGLDFSAKTSLELLVYGDASSSTPGPRLNVHFGQVNEDSDNSGGMTLHCANGTTRVNAPKTEDLNCDGVLSGSEDVGWHYVPAGLNGAVYGAANGRIDTQDLNHNGILDGENYTGGSFGYVSSTLFKDLTDNSAQKDNVNFTGWHTLTANMNVVSSDTYNWSAIMQVRLSLTPTPGGKTKGTIKIARLAAVGNTWKANTADSGTLQLSGINSADNPEYKPIFNAGGQAQMVYEDLYGSVEEQKEQTNSSVVTEQSLDMSYSVTSTATLSAYKQFSTSINVSQHGEFRFLVYNSSPTTNDFYMQLGNSSNYQEAAFTLDFTGWRLYVLEQADINGDNIADVWRNLSGYDVRISSLGAANFQQVSMLTAGVRVTDPLNRTGTVWLDEIHLGVPKILTGQAYKAQVDMLIPGWASFGAKYRYMDRNFQTPVTTLTGQDNEQITSYLNFTGIRRFPISMDYSRQVTVTPNTMNTGSNNLISLLQQGTVRTQTGNAKGVLQLENLPQLSLGYSFSKVNYELLTRKDDIQTYSAGLNYNVPGNAFYVPRSVQGSYSYSRTRLTYESASVLATSGYYNSDEKTDAFAGTLGFKPWQGASFVPNYSLQVTKESRDDYTSGQLRHLDYNKSMTQNAGFNSTLPLLPWLSPSFSYNSTIVETNNLTVSTVTIGSQTQVYGVGQVKNVNRTASGNVNLTLNGGQIFKTSTLLRTMVVSSNYQLQDGDSWANVEEALNTKSAIWLRTPLRTTSAFSSRTNLTLRDTVNSTQRWQPLDGYTLEGRWAALRTMSISNNFITSIQRSEVTGTASKTISRTLPDLVLSLSQLETLLSAERWASGANAYLKFAAHSTENVGLTLSKDHSYGADIRFILLSKLDTSLSGNYKQSTTEDLRLAKITETTDHTDLSVQTGFNVNKFRITPRVDYSLDRTVEGGGAVTQDTTQITPSVLIRADLALPKGLKLPFGRTLEFTNRIVWTTTTKYVIKRSPVDTTMNSNTLSCNSTADYELSKNLRLALNASFERLWHKYLPQEDYIAYQAGSTLTFQF